MLFEVNRANRAEIIFVREEGKFFSGPFFSLLIADLSSSLPSRFAFLVSKKVSPLSVGRHRLHRRLEAVVLALLPRFRPGQIVLFLPKPLAVGQTQAALHRALLDLGRQGRLFLNHAG